MILPSKMTYQTPSRTRFAQIQRATSQPRARPLSVCQAGTMPSLARFSLGSCPG